ncbi:HEXXH motif-containing putative peptide modification protein [Nonomuraea sp. NPDC052116]|uniref:aKG-HExxH-type peptide beta-hydroxylase n=1 Tax=Nonomuraea sp. NPDC052116 TaxID=3155665 RepID=UPI003433B04D
MLKCDAVELERQLGGDLSHPAAFALAWAKANGAPPALSKNGLIRTVKESRRRAGDAARRAGFAVDLTPLEEPVVAPTVERHIRIARQAGDVETLVFHSPEQLNCHGFLRQAHGLIVDRWPAMAQEIQTTVTCLSFFTAGNAIGFADICTHGLICLRADSLANVTVLAEEIIHESSHVRLNGILASTPCLEDDNGRLYQTPLREDPRPAAGLLHQLFVLARLHDWHARLGTRAVPERAERAMRDLAAAYTTVQNELPLTDAGRALVSTIKPARHAR